MRCFNEVNHYLFLLKNRKLLFLFCVFVFTFAFTFLTSQPAEASKIYWTSLSGGDDVWRADLDGNNPEMLVDNAGVGNYRDIALDVAAGKMYWNSYSLDKIYRANLDGSNQDVLIDGGGPSHITLDVSAGKIYWTDYDNDRISRANLDGTGLEADFIPSENSPVGLALDISTGKIYWTSWEDDYIRRADLSDPINTKETILDSLSDPGGLAVDAAGGKIYFTNLGIREMWSDDLDGGNPEILFSISHDNYLFLDLDTSAGKIYWGDPNNYRISRANFDGTGLEENYIVGISSPFGVALDLDPIPEPATLILLSSALFGLLPFHKKLFK